MFIHHEQETCELYGRLANDDQIRRRAREGEIVILRDRQTITVIGIY